MATRKLPPQDRLVIMMLMLEPKVKQYKYQSRHHNRNSC